MSSIQDQIRLREELLSNIAHEFRTPLASLVASTEMLSTEHQEMSVVEIDHLLRSLHRSIRRLESLVNNILDEASLRAGRFQVYPEPVELGDIIDEAVFFIQPMLDQRQQRLDVYLADDIGAVRADEQRIAQVLVNLLDNASKYGPEGQTVALRAVAESAHVTVSIQDHGTGIAPGQQAALFQRYSRLAKPGPSSSGTGLGLAIAKAIVERHGGEIGLESQEGEGTRVWFTLPRA
jgi:two-component system phosphate regulon sensor histidine kinase PhoR